MLPRAIADLTLFIGLILTSHENPTRGYYRLLSRLDYYFWKTHSMVGERGRGVQEPTGGNVIQERH